MYFILLKELGKGSLLLRIDLIDTVSTNKEENTPAVSIIHAGYNVYKVLETPDEIFDKINKEKAKGRNTQIIPTLRDE